MRDLDIRALRSDLRLTQQEFADLLAREALASGEGALGVDASMISKWERGVKQASLPYQRVMARMAERGVKVTDRREFISMVGGALLAPIDVGSVERLRLAEAQDFGMATVEQLASEVNGIVSVYESWPPDILFRYIMERQREVTRLLGLKAPPLLRSRLFAIAGRLAALNGNARFNCGDYSGAHQACQEAYQFAELVDDNELRSWTRINQCMFEIFYDRPRSALQFAMDGQVYAGRTGLGSYLANYEARAHATLGDKNKALLAVGRSYSIMDDLSTEDQGDPGFSITTHNRADLDCETSDVFLRLGDAPKAIEYASSARSVYDKTGLPSLRSQVRISEACGLIAAGEIDTARAQMAESVDLFLARPIDALLIWLDSIFRSLNAAQLKIMEDERDRVYEFRSRRKSSNAFVSGQVAEEALRDRLQR